MKEVQQHFERNRIILLAILLIISTLTLWLVIYDQKNHSSSEDVIKDSSLLKQQLNKYNQKDDSTL